MKTYKLLAGLIFLLLLASTTATLAYTPRGEGFVQVLVFATTEDKNEVVIGNQVDFSILIQNYWNDTMSNITMVQSFPADTQITMIGDQTISGEETALTDIRIPDGRSGLPLSFTYLNVTQIDNEANFTANIDITLQPDETLVLDFKLNFTIVGAYLIDFPSLTYYDHWGDEQSAINGQGTAVEIVEKEIDTRTQFLPVVSSTEPNYMLIIGGLLAIFVIAVLGRALHFKKPVEI